MQTDLSIKHPLKKTHMTAKKTPKTPKTPTGFQTIEDILATPKCSELVEKQIASIRAHRTLMLSQAQRGSRLKQGPYDYLNKRGLLTPQALIPEFMLIGEKKSKLPCAVREFIIGIV